MITFRQFVEDRMYVAPGKGQVTPEIREKIRHIVGQGFTSPKSVHEQLKLAGHELTYNAVYPYVRNALDELNRFG